METRPHGNTARDVEGGAYLQLYLVAAIATLLGTRLYLELTGYPKVGGGNLHIAHMLWGGLLMLVSHVMLLALLGRHSRQLAAVVGGAGFGLFIDELGKFITNDKDYFFQPTIALIYIVLVVLFLLFRTIERRALSPIELLTNAADAVRELVLGGATPPEVVRGLTLLERSRAQGPLADGIRAAIHAAVTVEHRPSLVSRWTRGAWRLYDRLLAWRWCQRAVLTVFIAQAAIGVAIMAGELANVVGPGVARTAVAGVMPAAASRGLAGLASAGLSALLVAIGVAAALRGHRLAAYRWFERSVLVAILLTQVILFWHDQLAALGGVVWNLVLLVVLRYMVRQEQGRAAIAALGPDLHPHAHHLLLHLDLHRHIHIHVPDLFATEPSSPGS
jgi:hypothetical protein